MRDDAGMFVALIFDEVAGGPADTLTGAMANLKRDFDIEPKDYPRVKFARLLNVTVEPPLFDFVLRGDDVK